MKCPKCGNMLDLKRLYVDDMAIVHVHYVCLEGHVWEELESQNASIICVSHSSDVLE
jgi:hypothetical protein